VAQFDRELGTTQRSIDCVQILKRSIPSLVVDNEGLLVTPSYNLAQEVSIWERILPHWVNDAGDDEYDDEAPPAGEWTIDFTLTRQVKREPCVVYCRHEGWRKSNLRIAVRSLAHYYETRHGPCDAGHIDVHVTHPCTIDKLVDQYIQLGVSPQLLPVLREVVEATRAEQPKKKYHKQLWYG